ncbi:4-hydroxy-tetrahydrodipicolinate synthase [Insolitispirillum peregrinum]|uniref:4-hydroxy-tetrahydrodipicolinate synthase n=1 Tax=Insolitispirillum peregrinum TaxID=80876 RepID=A0A1N7IV69_9PROT|nr:4-hydroxy-tetrahydrodipicolinate synthase [Insolitispirillum peregrinum]SIS40871.1 dihydrodipicolinate synthase [Insolitispirillum peregrinum]
MFKGSITALITPFTADGAVDEKAFQDFVQWQIDQGTDGLVPVGTTGESPTLTHDEHKRVVELCIEVAKGKVPVIAGSGSNSTHETIDLTRSAEKAGADAALLVMPYYNKPSQEGMYQHFKAVHDATDIPLVIYNIPGRSVVDMSVETMARLAELPRIVGVKDATADLARPLKTRLAIKSDFCQLSGEDATITAFLAQGGVGCISVTSNVAPALCAQLHDAWQAGDYATVWELRDRLMPLHDAMFCETSPAPVKYAASLLGKCQNVLRLPMIPVSPAAQEKVKAAMVSAGVLDA